MLLQPPLPPPQGPHELPLLGVHPADLRPRGGRCGASLPPNWTPQDLHKE